MRDTYCRFGFIDVLPAGAATSVRVDFKVFFVDFHHYVLGFGENGHSNGGRVNSALRLGVRHTLHAVNAAFVFEFCENSVAGNVERAFFQSAKLGCVYIDILDMPTLFFGVHFVHTHYFHCEKRGFLSACSAAYFDYYVFIVVGVLGK